jgi:low temperature requirement protein LtrA
MSPRNPDEPHRSSTPLELLFDLCFVVAVSFAATGLHHGVVEGHVGRSLGAFAMIFFAIWWAWMNFTWFATAFDTDDTVYRIAVFVQIAGALVLAAGVPSGFDGDYLLVTMGYLVMRLAGVGQWLRAAVSDPSHRPTTLRYALGIAIVQALWISRLALLDGWAVPSFLILVVAELAVPIWAERYTLTPVHLEHITERYGLFTIIVLGEAILGATAAVQAGLTEGGHAAGLLVTAGSGLVIVFSLWWLYFDAAESGESPAPMSLRESMIWGYGHYVVFGSAAALGAGFEILVDDVLASAGEGAHGVSDLVVGYSMVGPVATFVIAMWALQVLPRSRRRSEAARIAMPIGAVLIAVTPLFGAPIVATAVICVALVAVSSVFG